MKKNRWKKGLAAILGLILTINSPLGVCLPIYSVYAYTERSATINASSLNVRSGPGTSYSSLTKLARGAAVTVVGETTGSDGKKWYQIRFTGTGGAATTGYVLGTYVSFPVSYTPSADFEASLSAQGFPESYKDALRQLHAKYPNWIFETQQTGLDWNTVIENESVLGRNLVDTDSISSYKSLADGAYNWDNSTWTGFDGSTWVAASQEIISYYMDPRNFLDEVSVFQFLNHTYDASIQTQEGLAQMVKGTFLDGSVIYQGSASGSSSSGSSNVIGPGGSSGGTSSGGPGVVGGSSGSSGTSSGVIVSPSGGKGGNATLSSPVASISSHETSRVASSVTVVVGSAPGNDGSSQNEETQGTQGSSGTVSSPGGNSGSTSNVITAPQTSSSPVVSAPSAGGTSTGAETAEETQTQTTYVDIIMNAAQQTGLNPYVIASMIIQEQGSDGRGRSISGTVSGYSGYYNYFNVGAYAENGMSAVERGLWYASQSGDYGRPWNTPEKAIIGGAQFYATNYVSNGQDTFYLKKYNVQGSNLYKHQYMTNVDGAASEASWFAEGYVQYLQDAPLRFKIPVFNNMPASPCAKPTGSGSPNNKLNSLGVEGFTLTPTFDRDTYSYDLIVDPSVANVTVYANAIDSKASLSGTGSVSLQSGANEIRVLVKAENGSEREYMIHVVRQDNGPTYNANAAGNSSAGTGNNSAEVIGSGATSGESGGPGVSSGGPGGSSDGSVTGGGTGSGPTPGGSNVIVISPAG